MTKANNKLINYLILSPVYRTDLIENYYYYGILTGSTYNIMAVWYSFLFLSHIRSEHVEEAFILQRIRLKWWWWWWLEMRRGIILELCPVMYVHYSGLGRFNCFKFKMKQKSTCSGFLVFIIARFFSFPKTFPSTLILILTLSVDFFLPIESQTTLCKKAKVDVKAI